MARFIPPHPKKGTREAREHMARLRAMRGKKRLRTKTCPHRMPKHNPSSLRFRDLPIGAKFTFAAEREGIRLKSGGTLRWSGALGPWIKLSARTYKHAEKDEPYISRVGSINVRVYQDNPGARYHFQKADEFDRMDKAARQAWQKDFYHGKAVAHMESGLAARSMRQNPGRKRLYAAQIGARNFVIVEARSKAEATKQGRVMQASAMIGPFDSSQALRESIRRGFQGSELSPMFLNNPGRRHGAFRSCVRQVGRKLKQRGIPGSAPKICGKALRPNKNPLAIYGLGNPGSPVKARVAGVIYNRVHEVRAEKTGGFKPGLYRHPFTKRSKVCMLALDNGDILIHSQTGARLWKEA